MDNNKLSEIVDSLNKKQVETFEIIGKADKNGVLVCNLPKTFEFDENKSFYISLLSFETDSFFPNIDETNNKFYYSLPNSNEIKEIEFPTGAYDLPDYNKVIVDRLGKLNDKGVYISPINIKLDKPTGSSHISLDTGYKIYFNRNLTFRKNLGFRNEIVSESCYSSSIVDVLRFRKIFISCDIAKGSIFNNTYSNIIYSISNSRKFGSLISVRPNPIIPFLLIKKFFNQIVFKFFSEKKESIDFMGSDICLTILIKQC